MHITMQKFAYLRQSLDSKRNFSSKLLRRLIPKNKRKILEMFDRKMLWRGQGVKIIGRIRKRDIREGRIKSLMKRECQCILKCVRIKGNWS